MGGVYLCVYFQINHSSIFFICTADLPSPPDRHSTWNYRRISARRQCKPFISLASLWAERSKNGVDVSLLPAGVSGGAFSAENLFQLKPFSQPQCLYITCSVFILAFVFLAAPQCFADTAKSLPAQAAYSVVQVWERCISVRLAIT